MSDISLLIAGVLITKQTTGQPSPTYLPQSSVEQDNGVEKSKQGQPTTSIITAQITPPEFIQKEVAKHAVPLTIKPENHHRLNTIANEIKSKDLPKLTNFGRSQTENTSFRPLQQLTENFTSSDLPTLRFGNSGVSVKVLQRLLLSNGYAVRVDGNFGALTEAAVKAYQNRRNLVADGVVGQRTWYELTR